LCGDGHFFCGSEYLSIRLSSNVNNQEILEQISEEYFGGYGFVSSESEPRKEGWKRSCKLEVKNQAFLLCTLVPILESGEWYSASKREQFESWRDSLYERVNIDTLWERVEQHEQAKRQYEQLKE